MGRSSRSRSRSRSRSGQRSFPRNLMSKEYYHGLIGRRKAELNAVSDGEYLIWGEESIEFIFMLCIRVSSDDFRHYRLSNKLNGTNREWAIDIQQISQTFFSSIDKLVANYCRNGVPDGLEIVRMTKPAHRPDELMREGSVKWEPSSVGEGNFCIVHTGWMVTPYDAKYVAVKEIKVPPHEITDKVTRQRSDLMVEISSMTELNHPNVIKFYGIICDMPPFKVVMENCLGGSILSHIIKNNEKITDGERFLYAFEIARGMDYLASNGIVHRDLAARNVLISGDTTLRISDFGLSVFGSLFEDDPDNRKFRGPVRWMAPENLGKDPTFTSKSDVWAYGVILWEIFSGGMKPFYNAEVKQIVKLIRSCHMPAFPTTTKKEVVSLAHRCWNMCSDERPTFEEITRRLRYFLTIWKAPKPNERTLASIIGVAARMCDDLAVKWDEPDKDFGIPPTEQATSSTSQIETKPTASTEAETDEMDTSAHTAISAKSTSSRKSRTTSLSTRSVKSTQISNRSVQSTQRSHTPNRSSRLASQKSTKTAKSCRSSSTSHPSNSRRTDTKPQSAEKSPDADDT